jgi:UDP-N-acetyl-D-mannosaminuronic acid dehydrogenase
MFKLWKVHRSGEEVDWKIAVIGLGNAGLPLAAVIADQGLGVIGIDVNQERCHQINVGINPIPQEAGLDELISQHGGKGLIATANYNDAKDCNVFIVIVPVFVDSSFNPDFGILEKALQSVGQILKPKDLVVLETTVPPGTTDQLARVCLEEASSLKAGDFYLAYSPERIMTGYSISRLREFPKVIGGVDEESGLAAYGVYKKFIANLSLVSTAKTAELIKVMEGCYRDVNIALANELFNIAGELGIEFYEARSYANHQFCHIHLPSTGVGGHCIPVYPWFLIKAMEKEEKFENIRLLRTGREINDGMIERWAEKIVLEALNIDKPLKDVKICVKGLTYRQGAKEFYHSRNLALAHLLNKKSLNAYAWDELMSKEEVEGKGIAWIDPKDADLIFDCFSLKLERQLMA